MSLFTAEAAEDAESEEKGQTLLCTLCELSGEDYKLD